MRRVIIESPYAGDVHSNVLYAKHAVLDCLKRGEAPLASHLLFTQRGILTDESGDERRLGIAAGHAWIECADAVVVYADRGISKGMRIAIKVARTIDVKVEYRYIERRAE